MLPGECIGTMTTICTECQEELKLQICQSGGGYYLGFWCKNCGPYSRETEYMSEGLANKWMEKALEDGEIPWEIARG